MSTAGRGVALFDLDATLLHHGPAFRRWVDSLALPARTAARLVDGFDRHRGSFHEFFAWVATVLDTDATALSSAYLHVLPRLLRLDPDDAAALRRLRDAGWPIAIATNGTVDGQLAKIHGSGLDRLVDGWCISDAIGVRKPSPEVFAGAAAAAGATLDHGGWMVGNSLPEDIAGGRAAGLRTIWIDEGPASPEADFTARSVAEAVDVILRGT